MILKKIRKFLKLLRNRMPDDDIVIGLVKSNLRGVKIEKKLVQANGTTIWLSYNEYKFEFNKLPITLLYTPAAYGYRLTIDKVDISAQQEYLKDLEDKIILEMNRPLKEEEELIKKDIRITLSRQGY